MASMEEKSGLHEIDLMSLAIPQLNQLKNQLDQELNVFQESLETLKIAKNKLSDSGEAIKKMDNHSVDTEILVPLTSSMYVPGKIADVSTVILDIGTGYFIKKDREGAKNYFERKVNFLNQQIHKINEMGVEKFKVREAIVEVLDMKLQAELQHARAEQPAKVAAKT